MKPQNMLHNLMQRGAPVATLASRGSRVSVVPQLHEPLRYKMKCRQFQQTHLGPNYLPFCGHRPRSSFQAPRTLTDCQIKL
jgi:hypothetical protein